MVCLTFTIFITFELLQHDLICLTIVWFNIFNNNGEILHGPQAILYHDFHRNDVYLFGSSGFVNIASGPISSDKNNVLLFAIYIGEQAL